MFELDDTENFVGISEAAMGDVARDTAITYLGGLHHERTPADVGWPGDVVDGDRTEKTLRAFHRQWSRMMGDDEEVVSA
jgi:hypothetical protein